MPHLYFSRFLGYFLLYLTATNLIAQAPVPGDNFGYTQGSFSFGEDASANYAIPIKIPIGSNGLQPSIGLGYSSNAGNSYVGLGWSLQGISSIIRVGRTRAQDESSNADTLSKSVALNVQFNQNDRFSIDGDRLVLSPQSILANQSFDVNYGVAGTSYQTELYKFSQVNLLNGPNNAYTYFEVYTKDGLILEYGNTSDSRLMDPSKNVPIFWMINRASDRFGNYVQYSYQQDAQTGEILPSSISYTGNTSTNALPYNQITFEYEARPDISTFYGVRFQKANKLTKRLKAIKVFSQNTLIRQYNLSYLLNTYSVLTQLSECDGSNNCFTPINFSWGQEVKATGQEKLVNSPESALNSYADFNGDGISDILKQENNFTLIKPNQNSPATWYQRGSYSFKFYINDGNGTYTEQFSYTSEMIDLSWVNNLYDNPWSQQAKIVDMNGDNIEDLIITTQEYNSPTYGNIKGFMLLSNPSAANPYTCNFIFRPMTKYYSLRDKSSLDLNQDGIADYLTVGFYDNTGTGYIYNLQFNLGWIANKYPDGSANAYRNIPITFRFASTDYFLKPASLSSDFDGNGIADFIAIDLTAGYSYAIWGKDSLITDNTTERIKYYTPAYKSYQRGILPFGTLNNADTLLTFDLNGDNLPEIIGVFKSANRLRIFPNKGGAFDTYIDFYPMFGDTPVLTNYSGVYTLDQNSDGLLDFIFYDIYGNNFIFSNQQNFSFVLPASYYNQYTPIIFDRWFKFGVYQNGSIADVMYEKADKKLYIQSLAYKGRLLMTRIDNGAGAVTDFQYDNFLNKEFYKRANQIVYPIVDVQTPLVGISKVRNKTKDGYTETKSFKYEAATLNLEGRGFRGFGKIIETDSVTGIYTVKTYNQNFFSWRLGAQRLTKMEKFYSNGNPISKVENTPALIPYPINTPTNRLGRAKSFFAYSKTSVMTDFIKGITLTTRQTINEYGDPTSVIVDYGGGYKDSTVYNYYNNPSTWIIGKPTLIKRFSFAPTVATANRQINYSYNTTTGQKTSEITDDNLGDAFRLTALYEYNSRGNITKITQRGWNGTLVEDRVSTLTYDAYGRYVSSSFNPLNHQYSTIKDAWGNPLTETSPNGLTTTSQYDSFGRLAKQTSPDNTWEAYSYRKASANLLGGAGPAGTGYAVYKESSDGQMVIEYMDGFGRSVQSTQKGFDGNWVAITRTYRRTGTPANLEQVIETYPYVLGQTIGGYTVSQTDILGRSSYLYQTKSGGGEKVATITYNSLETSQTNFKSQIKKEIYNAKGWLLEARWNDGNNLYYGYDAESRLTVVRDLKGNTILNTYNARGDKTQTVDPDMGTYQYVYNAFGEVIKQTYPNGDIVTMEYDKLGRVTKKVENEGTTIYVYDTKPKGIGKPAEINSFAVNKSFGYDNLGRLNQEQTTISGKTYQTTRTFDIQGRLYELTYPSGFTMRHLYNNYGYLSQLKNAANNADLWVVELMDASGNITKQRFGNGIVTEKQIEATTQYLTSIRSTLNNNVVQQYSYNYDDLGNLTRRQDVRRNKSENFSYDAVNRLTQSQVVGATAVTMSYDELGNILSKSDVGAFEYGSTNAGPHRIVKVRSNTPTVPCSFQLNIGTEYNSFNKVKRISNDTAYVEITYGPDQLRIQQKMYVRGTLARTKTYVSGLVEIEEFPNGRTKTTTYLSGKGVLIQDKAANGAVTSNISYYLKDHLGSITGIANAAGTLTEEPSFDAWGNRRNADWTPLAQTYRGTERGFTEHEHYDLFSMIDMNGRVYDPILGRFLSPDPFIQDITNLQSLNRYSYVFNNPLNYVDPSGYYSLQDGSGYQSSGYPDNYLQDGSGYQNYGAPNLQDGSWNQSNNYTNTLPFIYPETMYQQSLGTIRVHSDGSPIYIQTSAPTYATGTNLPPVIQASTRTPVNQSNNVSQDGVYLGAGISIGNDYSTNQTSRNTAQVSNNQIVNQGSSVSGKSRYGVVSDAIASDEYEGIKDGVRAAAGIYSDAGNLLGKGLNPVSDAMSILDIGNKIYRGKYIEATYSIVGEGVDLVVSGSTGCSTCGFLAGKAAEKFVKWEAEFIRDLARPYSTEWGYNNADTILGIRDNVSGFFNNVGSSFR